MPVSGPRKLWDQARRTLCALRFHPGKETQFFEPADRRLYCPRCNRFFGYMQLIERTPLW